MRHLIHLDLSRLSRHLTPFHRSISVSLSFCRPASYSLSPICSRWIHVFVSLILFHTTFCVLFSRLFFSPDSFHRQLLIWKVRFWFQNQQLKSSLSSRSKSTTDMESDNPDFRRTRKSSFGKLFDLNCRDLLTTNLLNTNLLTKTTLTTTRLTTAHMFTTHLTKSPLTADHDSPNHNSSSHKSHDHNSPDHNSRDHNSPVKSVQNSLTDQVFADHDNWEVISSLGFLVREAPFVVLLMCPLGYVFSYILMSPIERVVLLVVN